MKEVPALVQGDLETLHPLALLVGHLPAGLPLEELVLLVRELVDPVDDLLVLHRSVPFSRQLAVLPRPSPTSAHP
jgi:hypothetical protein